MSVISSNSSSVSAGIEAGFGANDVSLVNFSGEDAARLLIADHGRRPMASMAYATAWAARLKTGDGLLFPQTSDWLRRHQHAEGCWGGAIFNPYDRFVSTLAAMMATREIDAPWSHAATLAGRDYLLQQWDDWRGRPNKTIGFDIIAPYLAGCAADVGLLPADRVEGLMGLRAEKLDCYPKELFMQQPTTLLYSLEAADRAIRPADCEKFLNPDGSIANNPAATGAFWSATGSDVARRYLTSAHESTADGGMPEAFPIDIFEPAWIMYFLDRAGIAPAEGVTVVDRLARAVDAVSPRHAGLGMSEDCLLPDSDDTAMVANVLHARGYDDVELLRSLLTFERESHFVVYAHERDASMSANGRILEVFARYPHAFTNQIRKIVALLEQTQIDGAWWVDKWHLSPYYATAQVVFGWVAVEPFRLGGTLRWLVDSQHPDGSWGMAGGLPEETAYAVLALDALDQHHGPVPKDVFRRAHQYLRESGTSSDYPELWVAKGLYTPPGIVSAAIVAALNISGRTQHWC